MSFDFTEHRCAHHLFEAQAAKTPQAVALVQEGHSLTYEQLNHRANRVAAILRERGVGSETLVGLFLERSIAFVVGALAVWKAGGAFVPLDPHLPQERLAFLLEETAVPLLLTQSHLQAALPDLQALVIDMEAVAEEQPHAKNDQNVLHSNVAVQPDHLAYMIYTSGSTGRPKAVMVEHRQIVHLLAENGSHFQVGSGDVAAWFGTVVFDALFMELFVALVHGASVSILAKDRQLDLPVFVKELTGATFFFVVPSMMRQILQTVRAQGLCAAQFDGVKTIFIGGESVSPTLLAEMLATFRRAEVSVVYGPTETTVICMRQPVFREAIPAGYPIGRALTGVELRVYDEQQRLVTDGSIGELYIAGPTVTRGYFKRAELTAEKFVELDGQRWYRSGDLVRETEAGVYEYVGRTDNQVKIRGYRIELGEIEHALWQQEAIREAVVIAREDGRGDNRLVAYLVPKAGQEIAVHELREHLLERLPAYMVPAQFVTMDALPLHINGKVNRRALPEPPTTRPELAVAYVPPSEEVEAKVAAIWSEVLNISPVGVQDSFVELGGHSLLATQIVTRITEALQVELSLRDLFAAPTVERLATLLTERDEGASWKATGALSAIKPVDREQALELSFAQQRLWLIDRMWPEYVGYNLPFAFTLHGALDVQALKRSVNELVRRHESLRTTFVEMQGQPQQVITEAQSVPLLLTDLQQLEEAERQAQMRQALNAEAQRPFDLQKGPLFRVHLWQMGAQEHVVLFTMHHIASDGWSMQRLTQDLRDLYAAFVRGEEAPLAELPVAYADYAAWQREWMQGDVLEAQITYWREKLAEPLPVLQLPTDRPRPATGTMRGAEIHFAWPLELVEGVKALSRQQGTTLFMTLLAAFKTLLFRYTGQTDLIVGTPMAGRMRAELEPLIGFFVNTLALRTELAGEWTFAELLERVRETALDAFAHQDVPFEKLVEVLQPDRGLGQSPFFQVVFQVAPAFAFEFDGLSVHDVEVHNGAANFDLSFLVSEAADGSMKGRLEYSTDLFAAETITRMMTHFQTLLAALVADPSQVIARVPFLTEAERALVVTEWNRTATEYPREKTIHQLFAEQAAKTPENVAVVFEEQQLTYAELSARASRMARHLIEKGVQPGDAVGLCMERSVELIVGLLGILQAGGTYVPLDPNYPQERLAHMIGDSQLSVLLVQAHLQGSLPPHEAEVVVVDTEGTSFADAPDVEGVAASFVQVRSDDPAYIIYTSGSTGTPKGVVVPHRGVVRLVKETNYRDFSADQVTLQFAPISFDPSMVEIWGALLNGGRLVFAPNGQLSLQEFGQVILQQGITNLFLTTGFFHQMVEEELQSLRHLQQLSAGGDVLSPAHAKKVLQQLPHVRLSNVYGPTENATISTWYPVSLDNVGINMPIGRPIANTQVYVLDAERQPVPVGVPGELYLGGDGLALGYWNRPELTEERFVPNPFVEDANAKMYKTGDLVRWLPDGNLEFLGRLDTQVKIRGFRIELGEIETVLATHPQVRETVVMACEFVPGDKRLVAYIVPEPGVSPVNGEVRRWLQERLPGYMVPSAVMVLETLPLTANGKVDRRALPLPDMSREQAGAGYVAPSTPVETVLAAIWAEWLGIERVGVHDSFVELGGHSLLATRIVSRIREVMQVEVPLRHLFDVPTVAELAKRVQELQGAAQRAESAEILPRLQRQLHLQKDQVLEVPVSFAQQRLWLLDRLWPDSPTYNIPMAWRLQGALDVAVLERSFAEIVRRHALLRTTFRDVAGEPLQVIVPELAVPVRVIELAETEVQSRLAEAKAWVEREAQVPFDLSQGPLLRVALLPVGAEDHLLFVNMHHIISDGWSLEMMMRELHEIYGAFATGLPSPLAELPIQYADYALWQREWLAGEVQEAQLAYWREKLAGELPVLQLPSDRPRPAVSSLRGAEHRFVLPSELLTALKELSKREGVTLFMTLLAAFQTLLYRYSSLEDILVGTPIAGRNRAEVEGLIGLFVNTLVLRTDLSGEPRFTDLLARVREVALGAYAHQDIPFDKLVEELQPERDLNQSPFFQVMFQVLTPADVTMPGMAVEPLDLHNGASKFDLYLPLIEEKGELVGRLEYSTELFDESTVVRFATHFRVLLEAVVADPQQQISKLPLLTAEERHQVLVKWNETEVEFPDVCLHELFEQQAARTPQHVAAIYGDEEITYAELDARANQLAHHLIALGVGSDVPVAVCIERSLELVVALIGILKAGGAYLPLDTEAPTARLALVMEDAEAPVCVAQSKLQERLPADVVKYVFLDPAAVADRELLASYPTTKPEVNVTPEHLVSIYYTSGSTGKPKGVANVHKGWVNRMAWMQRYYQLQPQESVLQKTTLTFDDAACEFYWPLMVGGRIALLEPGLHRDPRAILDAMIRYQVAFTTFVPSMLALFVDTITPQDREKLTCLRHIGSSGEALRSDLVRLFRERVGCKLHNTWGLTETSIDNTAHECTVADESSAEIVTIGRPFDNNIMYILDPYLQPVPIGMPGELYLAGICLAKNYLNNPERTAEAFLPNPFLPGERMYKTGDRGYYRANGDIMFLGRRDDQVKVRGQRVELSEIEAVLATHPALKQAVVAAFKRPQGYLLAAYYVLRDANATISSEALRAYMMERLPEYMVPWRFVMLEQLPVTVSGKIDRKQLPDPGDERPDLEMDFVAPTTAAEQAIAAIWRELLEVKEVGVHDRFFDLGGHSLTATRIISRINRELGTHLPLRALFEAPTVAGLAARVEAGTIAPDAGDALLVKPIPRVPQKEAYVLSHPQKRLWFQYQYDPLNARGGTNLYLLEGARDTELLLAAYRGLVARHGIMRTHLVETEAGPMQVVQAELADPIRFVDLSKMSPAEQAPFLEETFLRERNAPFDLLNGTAFRSMLIKLAEDRHLLFSMIHAIANDGWSITVLLNDFSMIYQALLEGKRLADLPPTVQYVDYAEWQHDLLTSGGMDAQRTFWLEQLAADVAPPKLPRDFDVPPLEADETNVCSLTIESELTEQIRRFASEQETTLYVTVLAGFKLWMALVSGAEEITVCAPISGRSHPDLESVLGVLVNPLAVRTDLSGNPSMVQALQQVKQTALGAYANQDYPFDLLLNELRTRKGDESNSALYTVVFVGQNAHIDETEAGDGLRIRTVSIKDLIGDSKIKSDYALDQFAGDPTVQFDLHIDVLDAGDEIHVHVRYNPFRFQAATVERFLQQYLHVLEQFVSNPGARLSQLELEAVDESEEWDELFS